MRIMFHNRGRWSSHHRKMYHTNNPRCRTTHNTMHITGQREFAYLFLFLFLFLSISLSLPLSAVECDMWLGTALPTHIMLCTRVLETAHTHTHTTLYQST